MPYKDVWGEKARQRSLKRREYFRVYKNKVRSKIKINARNKVANALKSGELTKQPCSVSNAECYGRIEAHHEDYTKPLVVIWLCSKHHREADARLKQGEDLVCKVCSKSIFFPKKKYCSTRCNLIGWRKQA